MQNMEQSVAAEPWALTDEQLATLSPAEFDHWHRIADLNLALRGPADFATRFSHGTWSPYRHLAYTSERIVAMIERDESDLLIVEEPVRHGKTELCSRWTPAWYIVKHRKRVLLASYEADFAATHGRRAREIVADVGADYGIKIDDTSRAAARWELEGGIGGMGTAGAGGPLTGRGGHLLIVDDPIKNVEEAQSPVMREHLWDWWQSTFLTRREPGGKVLVIMSRWHADDLIGRLILANTGMRIERVRLPAIAEDNDPLGRTPGQALCPERFDEVALAGIRVDVGPAPWSALYQQRPVALGGGMFRRGMFRYWTAQTANGSTFYRLGDHLVDDAECWRFSTMDPAYTKGKRSDYTVMATWAVAPTEPSTLMLLDVKRIRVEHAEHAPMIRDVWETHRPAWVGVEKQNATLSLFTDVQREGVVVRWLYPDRNKIARAETAVALVDAGRVFFPKEAPWLSEFEDELLTFPVAAHDDQVDVLSYAANEVVKRAVSGRPRRAEPVTQADRMWEKLQKRDRQRHLHPTLGRF